MVHILHIRSLAVIASQMYFACVGSFFQLLQENTKGLGGPEHSGSLSRGVHASVSRADEGIKMCYISFISFYQPLSLHGRHKKHRCILLLLISKSMTVMTCMSQWMIEAIILIIFSNCSLENTHPGTSSFRVRCRL